MANEEPEKSKLVSEREMDIAFSGPAAFVNKFYVTVGSTHARVAFTEQRDSNSEPQLRTAVAMTVEDLFKLRDIINRLEERIERVEIPVSKSING